MSRLSENSGSFGSTVERLEKNTTGKRIEA